MAIFCSRNYKVQDKVVHLIPRAAVMQDECWIVYHLRRTKTGSGAHPASYLMGTGGYVPGCKARPGRDADHASPSSAEVKYEWELYLLSPHAPLWRVAGQLYFLLLLITFTVSFFFDFAAWII
jgi:hypothetical protein